MARPDDCPSTTAIVGAPAGTASDVNLILHASLALAVAAEPPATPTAAPSPVAKVEVVGTIGVQAPPPAPDPVQLRRKSGRTYLVAGASTFATTYLFTTLYGVSGVDRARRTTADGSGNRTKVDDRGVHHGRALLLPVVGPFIAMHFARTATTRWLELLSGMTQMTGLVLTGVGIARMRRNRPSRRVTLDASASARGAMMGVSGRF